MSVQHFEKKAEFDAAVNEPSLLVLDCFATWCGPCKAIAPVVEKYAQTYSQARFYKFDVDALPELAQELGVRAMPTFVLFKDGHKVEEVVGANAKALETAIKKYVE